MAQTPITRFFFLFFFFFCFFFLFCFFTVANSNSFLCLWEILSIGQENKYLRKFSYFIMKLYTLHSSESPHREDSNECTQHTFIALKIEKISPKLSPFAP